MQNLNAEKKESFINPGALQGKHFARQYRSRLTVIIPQYCLAPLVL